MKLDDYMKARNGLTADGGIKFAMTNEEFIAFGITNVKGWARKNERKDIDSNLANSLLARFSKFKDYKDDNQFLYLIHCDSTGNSKIGISKNPKTRAAAISCAMGLPVKLASVWKVNQPAREIEKSLHSLFKKQRLVGEWFSGLLTSEEIESNIKSTFKKIV